MREITHFTLKNNGKSDFTAYRVNKESDVEVL